MATLTDAQLLTKYNDSSTGLFKDQTNREIVPNRPRSLVTDITDSHFNLTDDAYTGAKGQRAGITAPASLKDIATTSLPFTTVITFVDTTAENVVRMYELSNETTAENSPYVIRPNDYATTTNEKVWRLRSQGTTSQFDRTWTDTLVFDFDSIEYAPYEATGDISFQLGSGHLTNKFSGAAMPIIFDGTQAVNFPVGWRLLGITNGQIPEAGSYEIYFLYSNGNVRVNFPGVSQEQSGVTQLLTPSDFAVVTDGPNALDMSWSDVSNEVGYQIERSLTGTGGWTLYSNPAANATSDTETGLAPNTTIFYRIKAVGDGVSYSDSPYTVAAATTENTGDILAPTFTWNPANGTSIWPVNKPFTITANEPIRKDDGSTITNNMAGIITLRQTNSGGANIAHSWTINAEKTVITVTPTTTLGTNQLVYVSIDDVEDSVGNEITPTSITFTTTAYTYYNGTSNRMIFGDILDSVFAANDTNFWLERTLNNANLSGSRVLWAKMAPGASTECFRLYYNNNAFIFYFSMVGLGNRAIFWTGTDMDAGENVIVLKYDGSIDTNDGLDRCTLLINGVIQSTKAVTNPSGSLNGSLQGVAAQLSAGIDVNSAGTPGSTLWFEGEAKDSIIRSASGSTVELNVPVDRVGTDTSGNARNGTWG